MTTSPPHRHQAPQPPADSPLVPRTVLVTGASTGIGRATALSLAACGWEVIAGVRDTASAPTALDEAASSGGSIRPLRLDVIAPDTIREAMATLSQALDGKPLDALVNNAGIGQLAPMQAISLPELRDVFEVNVFGTVAVTQAALRLMRPGSRLVFLGSVGDRITMPFGGPLTSSKWAVASIAEAFRLELAADGIAVILIEPGSIHTPAVDKVEKTANLTAEQLHDRDPALADRFRRAAHRAVTNERTGSDPQVVADTILRALDSDNPRTRYLTGRHAHLLATLGKLPDPAFDRLRLRLFDQPTGHRPATRPTNATETP